MADPCLTIISKLVAQMTGVSEFSASRLYHRLLAQLVTQFDAESACLRHHNHALRLSTLIAEWTRQGPEPHPNPALRTLFSDDDVMLAGDLQTPVVVATDASRCSRYRAIEAGERDMPMMAVAPLLWGSVTTGAIGLTRAPGGRWTDDELETLGVVGALFAQIQARIAAENRLRRLAERDQLTGLHNRRTLFAEVGRRLRAGRPGPVAALFVDLDRLKTVNDHLGHAAGDVVIQTCAQRLTSFAGMHAMVARVGGDEFVVIPQEPMSGDAADAYARRLRLAVCGPVRVCGELITRTVSIGVAVGTPGIDTGEDLLHRADHAALAVKRNGGDAVAVCDHEPPIPVPSLAVAEVDNALELHYQPEVDMRTGEIVAVEALVNMTRSSRSDHQVMHRICGDLSRWRSHGVGLNVTVCLSISPAQLHADGFVETVASAIDESGIDPASIRLGIREQAMAHVLQDVRSTHSRLKAIGVGIAIDDYGRGDVAVLQLKKLRVDAVKIDAGITRELGSSATDLGMVCAIIGVADTVGAELTARGVETSMAAEMLLRHGCHRGQGHLLARPMGSDVTEALLSRRRVPLPQLATDCSAPFKRVRSVAS